MTAVRPPRPVTPAGVLARQLAELVEIAERDGASDEVRRRIAAAARLAGGLEPWVEECTTSESADLADLAARTAAHDWDRADGVVPLEQEMLSGHVEGQLLKLLVHATRARRVLEIGMFTGYSALALAEALPADGVVIACEIDPGVAAFAQDCFLRSAAGSRVDVRVGPAADTLTTLTGDRFDLVFVDADKAGYRAYVETVLDLDLVAPHGLLVVDNTLMQGQPWTADTPNGEAIAAFDRWLAADPRVEQVVVPLRDGVTLARRVDR